MSVRPGFFFCICPDPELSRRKIREFLGRFPPSSGGWEEEVFWAEDGLGDDFWQALTVQNLFGGSKALILRGAEALPAESWRALSRALAKVPPTVWPFLCVEAAFDNKGAKLPAVVGKLKCYLFAREKNWLWESPGLNAAGLKELTRDYFASRGFELAPGALEAIAAALPYDASAAWLELEKIALATPDKKLEAESAAIIAHEPEIDVFSFLRNIEAQVRGSAARGAVTAREDFLRAWRAVLVDQVSRDTMIFSFIGALLREARTLWQILFKEKVFLPDFILEEKRRLARSLGLRGVATLWDLALAAELGIKSGERKEDQALEALTAGLIELFQGKAENAQ